jgi:branched-chain amino acid transport system substrate-binding protein
MSRLKPHPTHLYKNHMPSFFLSAAIFIFSSFMPTLAEAAPLSDSIVLGQSLPLQGSGFFSADRIRQGALAYVAHVNATGGIGGRKIELVTLDDAGDPAKYEKNVRQLVGTYRAVAIIHCLGDLSCEHASSLAEELRVPLIGPISGARKLRAPGRSFTLPLRASYEVQADALTKQLVSAATMRVVIFTSFGKSSEIPTTLLAKCLAAGLETEVMSIDAADPRSLDVAAERLQRGGVQAVVLDLSEPALRLFGELEASKKFSWPATLASMSPSTLTQLSKEIRSRVIGFVSVVPNPEDMRLPVIRELNGQAEQFSGADAITFEGAEAYINLRVIVEALRRAGKEPTSASLRSAFDTLGPLDIGGFHMRLNVGRGGPTWVNVGMRSRSGLFLQ